MTTVDMLSRLSQIMRCMDEYEPALIPLKSLCADMEAQIRTETAKAKGCAGPTAVIARMLKNTAKTEKREALHYAWLDENGRQLTCDGYRAYRLLEPLPLPAMPAHVTPLDIGRIFFTDAVKRESTQLDVPGIAELKAQITIAKTQKATGGATWDFGKGLPIVNAAYLLDLLSVLPDAKLYASNDDPWFTPLYAEGAKGDAVLLPVRTDEKTAEHKHAKALRKLQPTGGQAVTFSLDDFAQIVDDLCA